MSAGIEQAAISRDNVSKGFAAVMDTVGPSAKDDSANLLARFRIRDTRDGGWLERFSDFTLLYPALQAEGIDAVAENVERATLAHALLLVHAFIEDRGLDGQMTLSTSELRFTQRLYLRGMRLLDGVAVDPHRFHRIRDASLDRHIKANIVPKMPRRHPREKLLSDHEVARTASGKAVLGFLSTAALGIHANCTEMMMHQLRAAYDATVTALQWADDIEDCLEDTRLGDCNFVIDTLLDRGAELRRIPDPSNRSLRVAAALLENDTIRQALDQARRWLELAVVRQERLSCSAIINELNSYIHRLGQAEERIRAKYEDALLVGALLA